MNDLPNDAMQPSRRTFAKLIAAALAALPIASSAADALGQTVKSRKVKRGTQARIQQTSPITVGGGGSVGIDFSDSYYKRVGSTNVYKGPDGDQIHKLWVTDKFGGKSDETPGSARCRIVIHCVRVDGAGNPIPNTDRPITIYGKPLALEVDLSDYTFGTPEGGSKDIFYHPTRKLVGNIEVFVGASPNPLPHPFPMGGSVEVLNLY